MVEKMKLTTFMNKNGRTYSKLVQYDSILAQGCLFFKYNTNLPDQEWSKCREIHIGNTYIGYVDLSEDGSVWLKLNCELSTNKIGTLKTKSVNVQYITRKLRKIFTTYFNRQERVSYLTSIGLDYNEIKFGESVAYIEEQCAKIFQQVYA